MAFGNRIRFWHGHREWLLTRRSELDAQELARVVPAGLATSKLNAWCNDASLWPHLLALYETLTGQRAVPPNRNYVERWLKPGLQRALESGQLVVLADVALVGSAERPTSGGAQAKPAPPPAAPEAPPAVPRVAAPAPALSWIEFRLVDKRGNALANRAIEVTLPDGARLRTKSDRQGLVRFDDIAAGMCQVALPDTRDSAWSVG